VLRACEGIGGDFPDGRRLTFLALGSRVLGDLPRLREALGWIDFRDDLVVDVGVRESIAVTRAPSTRGAAERSRRLGSLRSPSENVFC